jgi:hypothetical protein
VTDDDVLALLRARIAEAGNACAWAAKNGLHHGVVYLVLSGKRKVSAPSILVALGLKRVVRYLPREFPPEPRTSTDTPPGRAFPE